MGFVGAGQLLALVGAYRLCWISGKFSGGKTSIAFKIAQDFLERGYRLISNTRCVWADDPNEVRLLEPSGHLKAVIILDEGGLEFKSSSQIEQLAAYAAKMDCVYLIPSFFPPVRTAQIVNIQPIYSLKNSGLPIVVYKWRARLGGFEDKGWFLWVSPDVYGYYSRQDPGARTTKIVQLLIERKNDYRKRFGYNDDISEVEEPSATDILRDVADTMAEASDGLSSFSVRIRRRK